MRGPPPKAVQSRLVEAACLCPKCGIELQAEPGTRCPLCGTPLEGRIAVLDAAFAATNPSIPAPSVTPPPMFISPDDEMTARSVAVPSAPVPVDPESAPTERGWSIDAPAAVAVTTLPSLSAPFTPMPPLTAPATPPTILPPPPFVGLAPSRPPPPAPVLRSAGASSIPDPRSDVTGFASDPTLLAPAPPRPAQSGDEEEDDDGEEPIDASSLEITTPGPSAASLPPAPTPSPRARPPGTAPPPPSPWSAPGAPRSDLPPIPKAVPPSPAPAVVESATLSPKRVTMRPAPSGVSEAAAAPKPSTPAAPQPKPSVPAPSAALDPTPPPSPAPAVGTPRAPADPTLVGIATARPSPSAISPRPSFAAREPKRSRGRGVLLFLLSLAGMAGAFYAGRVTAPAAGDFPFPAPAAPAATPVASAPLATPEPTPAAADPPSVAPSPEETPAPSPAETTTPEATPRTRRARAGR